GAHGGRERRAAAAAHEPRRGRAPDAREDRAARRRARGPDAALPAPALRRTGAARGHRARHRQRPQDHRGRRAHRRPRSQGRRRHPRLAREAQHRPEEDHLHGHPRPGRRRAREDHPPPRQGTPRVMTLTGLAIRNLTRNRFRVVLTIFGVSVMILTFLLIRTVNWSWGAAAAFAAKDRVVTRHKVTFVMSLPKRYVQQVKNSPHVKQVTFANWFGGKDPKHDREFFSTLGVDNATYFDVYNELSVPPEQLATFQHDKQGAIVGDVLAKKLGWKVGDKVPLESGIYPGDWEFHIDGIYTTTAHSVDRSTLLFHWDYMNDALPDARKDGVGWIVSRVDDPSLAADVGVALDKVFDSAETPTLSQD